MALAQIVSSGNTSTATYQLIDSASFSSGNGGHTGFSGGAVTQLGTAFNVPNPITVDGLALFVTSAAVPASASGQITIQLRDSLGGTITNANCTINAADLDSSRGVGCWVFFKFAASVSLSAGNYTIWGKNPASTFSFLYTGSIGVSWWPNHYFRTTSSITPTSTDVYYMLGEFSAPGTYSNFTFTNDGTHSVGQIIMGERGFYQFDLTPGTTRTLNWNLDGIVVWGGGNFSMGTRLGRVPSTTTINWNFFNGTSGGSQGIFTNGGGFYAGGYARTYATSRVAANVSSGNTVTLTDSVDWGSGDSVLFATSLRTSTPANGNEIKTVSSAVGTTVTVGSAFTQPHIGPQTIGTVSTLGSHAVLMNRNININGTSTANYALIRVGAAEGLTGDVDISWVNFNSTAMSSNHNGSLSLSPLVEYCTSVNLPNGISFSMNGSANSNNTFQNNVAYGSNTGFNTGNGGGGTGNKHLSNIAISCGTGHSFAYATGDFSNNVAFACATPLAISTNRANSQGPFTVDNPEFYSNVSPASINSFLGVPSETFNNWLVYRAFGYGVAVACSGLTLNTSNFVQNASGNIQLTSSGDFGLNNSNMAYDSTLTTAANFGLNGTGNLLAQNCNLGITSTGNDFATSIANSYVNAVFNNCTLGNSTNVSSATLQGITKNSYIGYQRINGTAQNHRAYRLATILQPDTFRYIVSPGLRVIPITSAIKSTTQSFYIPVQNGVTATYSLSIRESTVSSGDSGSYSGAAPRIILKQNTAAGYSSDTVIGTYSGAAGAFHSVSFTIPAPTMDTLAEIYVDCDGISGFISIDSFVQGAQTQGTLLDWWSAAPFAYVQNSNVANNKNLSWFDGSPAIYLVPNIGQGAGNYFFGGG